MQSEWTLDSFDFDGSPRLVEVPQEAFWTGLPALAARFPGQAIAGIFGPITQMERSFSAALRRVSLPALCLQPERASLLRTLAKELPLGAVVALWSDRSIIEPLRAELPNIFVQYVLAPGEEPERLPNTAFERHRIPGVVEEILP
jgi:hypothetical protein